VFSATAEIPTQIDVLLAFSTALQKGRIQCSARKKQIDCARRRICSKCGRCTFDTNGNHSITGKY